MLDKMCPFLSAQNRQNCVGEECMLHFSGKDGGVCGLVKAPSQVASKLDIISAQVQEMQVALLEIANAKGV